MLESLFLYTVVPMEQEQRRYVLIEAIRYPPPLVCLYNCSVCGQLFRQTATAIYIFYKDISSLLAISAHAAAEII